jgi:hypothetical protein
MRAVKPGAGPLTEKVADFPRDALRLARVGKEATVHPLSAVTPRSRGGGEGFDAQRRGRDRPDFAGLVLAASFTSSIAPAPGCLRWWAFWSFA